jgi:hypothetical protein
MRVWIVRTIGLAAVGVLALSLSACTVPEYGRMAVGVGPGKELVAYLVMCRHHIDGASIYFVGSHNDATVGEWVVSPAATGVSAFPLVKGGNGWKSTVEFRRLLPGAVYRMYGWTNDSSASAGGPTFTSKELSALKPWQVWAAAPNGTERAMTLNNFVTHVCDYVASP